MAGVTVNGFVPKRLNEIIRSLEDNAKPIFQDLVKPGEEVDVSANSTIGRMIGLVSLDLDELWQGLQEVYQAFDPNSATGVALDNIVQYMAIQRRQGKPTVVRASVWGELGVNLPQGQVVRASDGTMFESAMEISFTPDDFLGAGLAPVVVQEGVQVGFTLIVDEGIYEISYTPLTGDTLDVVLAEWLSQFNGLGLTRFTSEVRSGKFYVVVNEYFSYITIPQLINTNILEIKKRLPFNSQQEGAFNVPLNTLRTIVTPVFGWISVDNEISAEQGSIFETDEELRERFRVSKAVRASNLAESLYSRLLELEGVTFVRVYENLTNLVDGKGMPPHSFMAVVRGGVDTDVGSVVWANKPLGIGSYGNTSVTVRDSQNVERVVQFSRAEDIPIYVRVTVAKTDNSLPDDAVEKIREAVVTYINSQTTFGENVYYTRMFTPVNSIQGHQIISLEIGKTEISLAQANIPIAWNEYPFTFPEYVEVIVNT